MIVKLFPWRWHHTQTPENKTAYLALWWHPATKKNPHPLAFCSVGPFQCLVVHKNKVTSRLRLPDSSDSSHSWQSCGVMLVITSIIMDSLPYSMSSDMDMYQAEPIQKRNYWPSDHVPLLCELPALLDLLHVWKWTETTRPQGSERNRTPARISCTLCDITKERFLSLCSANHFSSHQFNFLLCHRM